MIKKPNTNNTRSSWQQRACFTNLSFHVERTALRRQRRRRQLGRQTHYPACRSVCSSFMRRGGGKRWLSTLCSTAARLDHPLSAFSHGQVDPCVLKMKCIIAQPLFFFFFSSSRDLLTGLEEEVGLSCVFPPPKGWLGWLGWELRGGGWLRWHWSWRRAQGPSRDFRRTC